jgi:hypothetical protein
MHNGRWCQMLCAIIPPTHNLNCNLRFVIEAMWMMQFRMVVGKSIPELANAVSIPTLIKGGGPSMHCEFVVTCSVCSRPSTSPF